MSWNGGAERIFGYLAEELIGKRITILIPVVTLVSSSGCPSSDDLRLVRRFVKGGSGSSGLEFKRPATDAASVG